MARSENQYPVVQQQRVTIQNHHGEKLVGIMHETGSTEIVIVCHGFRSSKDRIPMTNLAVALEKEGISAFRFDFAGNGESEGVFRYGSYHRETDDLRAVVQYILGEKRSIAAIVGHSKGGNVVLLYASMYNDVCNVVNISGRFDLKRGIEGRLGKDFLERIKQHGFIDVKNRRGELSNVEYCVTEESLMDRLTTDTHAACLSIPHSCRVLTVHGSMDEMVPVEDAKEFFKYISNTKLHIIEGADHEYTKHQDELASIVLNFLAVDPHEDKDMPLQFASCTREKKFHSRF
ncbi:putative uncharacterized protein YDL057W isoform X1 [Rhododendron vialii]|uniref:putative uncharacterized protein YDL057W isoform X1 n=1 Tax=Rhododendron vialii TaxID=182163 RepID=UPI00265F7170|nr:putative uncharacterized protein YDL057W isoform X1 [Rhododendron vialii]